MLAGRARFKQDGDSWQVSLYHEVDYLDFQKWLQKQGFSLPHCQVMNSRKRQPQRKIFVAAVLIGGLKQKNPRLYQGNKNFSIA